MYVKHCKLSEKKQLELMKYFVVGATARTAAGMASVHRNTAVRFFHKLRAHIAAKQEERAERFGGKVEVDESFFGGRRKASAAEQPPAR